MEGFCSPLSDKRPWGHIKEKVWPKRIVAGKTVLGPSVLVKVETAGLGSHGTPSRGTGASSRSVEAGEVSDSLTQPLLEL